MDGPSKGSLGAISGDEVTYTPDAGEFGADSFTYRASDGLADSEPATAHVTITRPPNCEDVPVLTAVGAAVQVPLECTDPDGDAVTFSIVDGPSNGTLGPITGDEVTYTPDAGEFGADSFSYAASDGTAESPVATVNVMITRPPACEDIGKTVRVGSSVSVPLTCLDPDGDDVTLAIDERPSQARSARSRAIRDVHAGRGRRGRGRLHASRPRRHRRVRPGHRDDHPHRPAAVRRRHPPHAGGDPRRGAADVADPDGDTLTLAIAEGPTKGTLGAISGGSVTYTPDAGEHGEDTFTYTANDGEDSSEPATATITITRAPICEATAAKTAVGEPVSVPLSCTDEDGDTLALAKASDPAKGTLGAFSASSVTYTPAAGEYGATPSPTRRTTATATQRKPPSRSRSRDRPSACR